MTTPRDIPSLLGAILVGGASKRYGRPKGAVPVGGIPMAKRAADALRPWSRMVGVVGADPAKAEALAIPARADTQPGRGPLGGLHTALQWAREEGLQGVLLLGCDLPLVGAEAIGVLVRAWSGEEAVVPWHDNAEPVCALYSVDVLDTVELALADGPASLHELLAGLRVRRVSVDVMEEAQGRCSVLLNVNAPADRMRAEALLHDGPPLVCVVGKKNSGKTTLTVALAAELSGRGLRVMTVKHGHGFDLDREGSDSWRHRREGGAEKVLLVGPEDVALMGEWGREGEPALRALVDRYLADAEVVVAEGWKTGPDPKVEVYRVQAHREPVFDAAGPDAHTFLATVTDLEGYEAPHPVFRLTDADHVVRIADRVVQVLL